MPDISTLIALSVSLMLHNAHCTWIVSEPLNHTLNDDGSVNVTCMILGVKHYTSDAKLKMNDKYVCEVAGKGEASGQNCLWHHKDNKFMFQLKNPKDIHKSTFSCEISRVKPIPVETKTGPQAKLFQGCNNAVAPLSCPCYNITVPPPVQRPQLEDIYPLLILGLTIVLVMLSFYSIIVTVAYIRLRDQKLESADNLTYVPMQRNVKRRDIDNTEYVDMREVQKRGGSHKDMNHNSHLNHF
ncbi:uncharacterized protein si:ch211-67e16.3 [Danio aesculapii]|uniref:uncharacterized protein si:ch211-67e16.3 n=1 Tax=Danio aesculapii TaxID=1142201 RepID=UPI0024BF7176|nr:uncharacterized protein si:ch211-67e16.3 [Danio aesculapii]